MPESCAGPLMIYNMAHWRPERHWRWSRDTLKSTARFTNSAAFFYGLLCKRHRAKTVAIDSVKAYYSDIISANDSKQTFNCVKLARSIFQMQEIWWNPKWNVWSRFILVTQVCKQSSSFRSWSYPLLPFLECCIDFFACFLVTRPFGDFFKAFTTSDLRLHCRCKLFVPNAENACNALIIEQFHGNKGKTNLRRGIHWERLAGALSSKHCTDSSIQVHSLIASKLPNTQFMWICFLAQKKKIYYKCDPADIKPRSESAASSKLLHQSRSCAMRSDSREASKHSSKPSQHDEVWACESLGELVRQLVTQKKGQVLHCRI